MNFDLTPDQEMLQQSVLRLLADTYSFEKRKTYLESTRGWSEEVWKEFAEMGLLGLPFSADDGGFGGGAIDSMLIMEAMGGALSLEPYFATVTLAGTALKLGANAAQRDRWLPTLIGGQQRYALAHVERGARYDLAHVRCRARRSGKFWILTGSKDFVIHGDSAHKIIVSARHDGADTGRTGFSLFMIDAAAVKRRSYRAQDGTCMADLVLEDVAVSDDDRIGDAGAGLPLVDAIVDTAIAALAAEAVGVMQRAHEITIDYLKIRKQFGATIGSFQALQHRAVDMLVTIEQARSMAMYASVMSERNDPVQRRQAVSAAKSFIGRAGKFIGEQAVQLHGGIGVTEECAVGHYYRRLTLMDLLFGDSAHHLAQVAAGGALP